MKDEGVGCKKGGCKKTLVASKLIVKKRAEKGGYREVIIRKSVVNSRLHIR